MRSTVTPSESTTATTAASGFHDAYGHVVVFSDTCDAGGQRIARLELRDCDDVVETPRCQRLQNAGRRILGLVGPGHSDGVNSGV